MQMGEKMDEGDILSIQKIAISEEETSATLFEKFGEVAPDFLIKTLFGHFRGEILPVPQKHEEATYCQKFTKEQGRIDVKLSASELYRRYQAYTPWPTLYGEFEGKHLTFSRVSISELSEIPSEIGQISFQNNQVFLKTGKGILILEELKLE